MQWCETVEVLEKTIQNRGIILSVAFPLSSPLLFKHALRQRDKAAHLREQFSCPALIGLLAKVSHSSKQWDGRGRAFDGKTGWATALSYLLRSFL